MASSRIAGPVRGFDQPARPRGPLGCDVNALACEPRNTPGPLGVRGHRPIRVADAPKKDSKKPAKQPATPAATKTVHLHFYLLVTSSYSATQYYDWLRGPVDADHPFDRWEEAGVNLIFHSARNSGADDLKKSLQDPGTVVVYFGHSSLDFKNKRCVGLTPKGLNKAEIPAATLVSLLEKSKAKLVILATCASSTCVGKLTAGPGVVVTESGANLKTWSFDWAQALGPFLFVLLGYEVGPSGQPTPRKQGRGTINEALDAANEAFKNQKTDDRFTLANGDGSKVVF
jgi:hypothetical protein